MEMNLKNGFMTNAERIGRALLRRYNVKVNLSEGKSYTDGTRIYIDSQAGSFVGEAKVVFDGILDHEIGHLLHTQFSAENFREKAELRKAIREHRVLNVASSQKRKEFHGTPKEGLYQHFEDIRINRKQAFLPGCLENICEKEILQFYMHKQRSFVGGKLQYDLLQRISLALRMQHLPSKRYVKEYQRVYREFFTNDKLVLLFMKKYNKTTLPKRLDDLKSTGDTLDFTESFFKFYSKFVESQKEKQESKPTPKPNHKQHQRSSNENKGKSNKEESEDSEESEDDEDDEDVKSSATENEDEDEDGESSGEDGGEDGEESSSSDGEVGEEDRESDSEDDEEDGENDGEDGEEERQEDSPRGEGDGEEDEEGQERDDADEGEQRGSDSDEETSEANQDGEEVQEACEEPESEELSEEDEEELMSIPSDCSQSRRKQDYWRTDESLLEELKREQSQKQNAFEPVSSEVTDADKVLSLSRLLRKGELSKHLLGHKTRWSSFPEDEVGISNAYAEVLTSASEEASKVMRVFVQKFHSRSMAHEYATSEPNNPYDIIELAKTFAFDDYESQSLHRKVEEGVKQSIAISFVIDASGSMGGTEIESVTKVAAVFAEAFRKLGFAFEIICHNSPSNVSFDCHGLSGRRKPYRAYIVKGFDENCYKNIALCPHLARDNNADGAVMQLAGSRLLERHEDRKILFYACDGAPTAYTSHEAGINHMVEVAHEFEKNKIEFYSIGIDFNVSEIFGAKKSVNLNQGNLEIQLARIITNRI